MKWLDLLLNKYRAVRIAVLATAIYATWVAAQWGMAFATGNERNGMEIAAILAAIQAPITLFAGSVFRAYIESRKDIA